MRNLRPVLAASLALLFATSAAPAFADDRDVLRDSAARPYVFFILDTSGSMNWAPRCTQAQFDAGTCDFLCPTGDCAAPRNGDDPASKLRQAKEAIYEVISGLDDIDFGFATYNQDDLRVNNKQRLYRVRAGEPQVALAGGFAWPAHGSQEVFGFTHNCDSGNGVNEISCYANGDDAADVTDAWELDRARRYPKLGTNGETARTQYVRSGGRVYFLTYDDPAAAQTLGAASILVRIRVDVCTDAGTPVGSRNLANPVDGCNAPGERSLVNTVDVDYDLVGEYVPWELTAQKNPVVGSSGNDYYAGDNFNVTQSNSGNTCFGLDPNTDSNSDDYNGYNLKYPTVPDPDTDLSPELDYGDFIPLDWRQSNRDLILSRLAPRLGGADPATDPEAFANATYLEDTQTSGILRLKSTNHRPIIPSGSTPLGYSLKRFRSWYRGCDSSTSDCSSSAGWDDLAAAEDTQWGCRRKYIIFLTDGDDTCNGSSATGGDTCRMATRLRNDGVSTYVVGFGVAAGSNQMNCMAANGGTVAPILPQNKQELIDALTNIFGAVREEASAFASAAVPQVQANVTDKIFLSSFTPLNDASYWGGRLDAFLKPLPTVGIDGRPDRSVVCDSSRQSRCFLWDAGDFQTGHRGGSGVYAPQRLLQQAPHPDDVTATPPWDASELQIGVGADERRLLYSQFSEPGNRRLFEYPSTNSEKYDLWSGLGISFVVGDMASESSANDAANATIVTTLLEKEAIAERPNPSSPGTFIQEPVTYLLGDIFHADPVVFGRPTSFDYYALDPYLRKPLCGDDYDPARFPPTSYRWFADRNFCRRSVLVAAANDGQLHAFDAGIFRDAGGTDYECLLPAKDLDGDGTAESNEFADSLIDYDVNDQVDSLKSCATAADCASGPCEAGFCRDVKVGVVDGAYDNGTGREIFSFIPRAMLPTVQKMAKGADRNSEFWGMDAGIRLDDVFIDPLAAESGSTTCLDREWRTVVIGGYREGGPGYYALDLTQPDALNAENVPEPDAGYVPSCINGGSNCGALPYPAVLWEFQDKATVEVSAGVFQEVRLDEDANGLADLGNSWSRATTGRIRVCGDPCDDDSTEDRFVAIFGGGMGDNPVQNTGNFLYMVDIETGKTIYKQPLIGSAPADVAAIDTNGDAYIDRLYVGTTRGFLYKVDLETSPLTPMTLVTQTHTTLVAGVLTSFSTERLEGPSGDAKRYDPYQLFSTGGRPIYHEVAAIYAVQRNRFALGFGTGNRWNLWDESGEEGRFYMILDDNYTDVDRDGVVDVSCSGCTQPLTESSFQGLDPDSTFDPSSPVNYLFGDGPATLPGWYFRLKSDEKMITEAFSLAGITIFTAFDPEQNTNSDGTCRRVGESRIFIVGTVTALGYNIDADSGDRTRYRTVDQFTTPPFVEQSATANPESGTTGQNADMVTDELAEMRDELKTLQSNRCKYANYTQNIKTIRSDTGMVFVVPIPLCIDPTSWKEF